MKATAAFRGPMYFLSNMFECKVVVNNLMFSSSESAFQALKFKDRAIQEKFSKLNGPEAKFLGRTIEARSDWDDVKLDIMKLVLIAKFTQNRQLGQLLVGTGDMPLVEENEWKDKYWGKYKGEGENHLGILLEEVREMIKPLY